MHRNGRFGGFGIPRRTQIGLDPLRFPEVELRTIKAVAKTPNNEGGDGIEEETFRAGTLFLVDTYG